MIKCKNIYQKENLLESNPNSDNNIDNNNSISSDNHINDLNNNINIHIDNNNNIMNENNKINNNINRSINSNVMPKINKRGRKPQEGVICNRRYQIFVKHGYTYWNRGENRISRYLENWMKKCHNTLHILSWSRFKLKDDRYISYICDIYSPGGGKTYQNYLPPDFTVCNNLTKDNIINIVLGLLYPDKIDHKIKYLYQAI